MFRSKHSESMGKSRGEKSTGSSGASPQGEDQPRSSADADPSSPQVDGKSDAQEPLPEVEEEEEYQKEQPEDDPDPEISNIVSSAADFDTSLFKLSEEVDEFLDTLSNTTSNENDSGKQKPAPQIPESVEKFAKLVQVEVVKCVSGDASAKLFEEPDEDELSIFESIEKIAKLTTLLRDFQSEKEIVSLVNLTTNALNRAMIFLEEEFRFLLEIPRTSNADSMESVKSKRSSNSESISSKRVTNIGSSFSDPDRGAVQQQPENVEDDNFPGYSMEAVTNLKKIAAAMISSGYQTECRQIYSLMRRAAFEDALSKLGFEKISIDEVQNMKWEPLEKEIMTWIKVMKQAVNVYFPGEQKLCDQVFSEDPSISGKIFNSLIRNVVLQLLNFAEAVALTKRSAEKLFKFLDMYETLRDLIPTMNELFADDLTHEMRAETQSARARLGEAAVAIFCDLENSIKSESAGKTPIPGGAVHPVTRYTINYVKYACSEYKDTLEQVFEENRQINLSEDDTPQQEFEGDSNNDNNQTTKPSPFAQQLMSVMDLLDSNLEAKSKLYKEVPLSYIFLMNNGRYIMQKMKESGEIYDLLGNTWSRKRSSDLRTYHKNYQRETWAKVLACLRDEGLQVNGKVQKPVLKERFKNFNSMFEEIHRSQSSWIVSDNQLQSELCVSISAVVIPAYRSFLGRFQQYLDAGRQTEKYIKYGPDDIESHIESLFSGKKKP